MLIYFYHYFCLRVKLRDPAFWDRHFCQQYKHIPLTKIWTMCKAVDCFFNVARVKYSMMTSRLHLHLHLNLLSLGW